MELITQEEVTQIMSECIPFALWAAFDKKQKDAIQNYLHTSINEKINENRIVKAQSFRDNTKAFFEIRDVGEWPMVITRVLNELFKETGRRPLPITILNISGYHGLGNKETEFYDIEFENGAVLNSICGYHLSLNEDGTS